MADDQQLPPPYPTFAEALRVWVKIGLLSFGGPAGQIALMHRELVERRRWISEERFLHALNYCMLLPGPEAQQLATYVGWLLHGWRGGVVAGLLFVLPGFFIIVALATTYALYQDTAWLSALFFGLKAAVLAIVADALVRVSRRALKNKAMYAIAAAAFMALFMFDAPFPLVILAAGVIGYVGARANPQVFSASSHGAAKAGEQFVALPARALAPPTAKRSLMVAAICGGLWFAPFPLLYLAFGWPNAFIDMAVFFSKMAVVTFGGAYAVLAYVAQQAVENYAWLKPGEMLDGLAMAETTPGPLILVLTYVATLAGFRNPMSLDPLGGALLGAFVATWVTFAPCFLWIFLGAPYMERTRQNKALAGALTAITAAVVGVILNLALWFVLHVLFTQVKTFSLGPLSLAAPVPSSLDPAALALAVLACVALFRFKIGVLPLLALCGALGFAFRLAASALA
ncbi:MAG: chromate efflux transporter [Beijerinckiaceae bacterium]|nr:chromate efflux transporter [Beijerinckiaceae bacterium]